MIVDLAKCQRTTAMGFEDKLQSEPLFSLRKYMPSTCCPNISNKNALERRPFQSKTESAGAMVLSGLGWAHDFLDPLAFEPLSL